MTTKTQTFKHDLLSLLQTARDGQLISPHTQDELTKSLEHALNSDSEARQKTGHAER